MSNLYKTKKRILFVTHRDARDKKEWSGTFYSMAQSLSKHSGEVIHAGPYYPIVLLFFLKVLNKLSIFFLKKKYRITYSYLLAYFYRLHFSRKIKKEKPNIIFAPSSSGEISLIKADQPKVYLGDATLNLLLDTYPNYTNLSKLSLWEAQKVEHKAFSNATSLVFSSDWAASSAMKDYNVPREKIHIIPYGANMEKIPSKKEIEGKNIKEAIKVLFLGVDWDRKGGDLVYDSFLKLQEIGINSELVVCGCIPPNQYNHPKMQVIPYLDKNKESDAEKLYNVLLSSNFLFIPSKSDCTPIVFCEANAFGIPVLTTDVGGITSVITDGINGHTYPLNTSADIYAEKIAWYSKNPDKYIEMVKTSRQHYEQYLNWDNWGIKMNELFERLLSDSGSKKVVNEI